LMVLFRTLTSSYPGSEPLRLRNLSRKERIRQHTSAYV
jgi:hypothetical protein